MADDAAFNPDDVFAEAAAQAAGGASSGASPADGGDALAFDIDEVVAEAGSETTPSRSRYDVHGYDFKRPNRVSRDRLLAIQAILDRFAGGFESFLTGRLRSQIKAVRSDVSQVSFAEYTLSLSKPCNAFVFDLGERANCQAVVEVGHDLPLYFYERLLGGPGSVGDSRPLTQTERHAIQEHIAEPLMREFAEAWQEHVPFAPRCVAHETTPEVLDVVNRDDPVLVCLFTLSAEGDAGKWVTEDVSVCIPILGIEKFLTASGAHLGRAKTARQSTADVDRAAVAARLLVSTVEVRARFPSFSVPLAEIRQARAGDVLHTGLTRDARLEIYVQDRLYFLGLPGRVPGMDTADAGFVGFIVEEAFIAAEDYPKLPRAGRLIMANTPDSSTPGADALQASPLADLGPAALSGNGAPLESVLKLRLDVAIEVGRTRMTVGELLQVSRGSVIPLDRLVGEPLDVFAGGTPFAEGEVVVLGEHFGIRITRIIGAKDSSQDEV